MIMTILRKRDVDGEEQIDFFGLFVEDTLQLIANHTKPYIGPRQIEMALLNKEIVTSKYGSVFYVKELWK